MISVIIVLFRSEKFINSLIDTLNNNIKDLNKSFDSEFIFIKNDQNKEYDEIKLSTNNVKFIKTHKNLGYSKALNLGISKSKGEHILILNPDIKLSEELIKKMYSKYNNIKKIGVLGPKIYNIDNSFQESCRRMFPTPMLLFKRLLFNLSIIKENAYNYSYVDKNQQCEVDSVSGACMMFPVSLYYELKGFDERFFLYFEDTDFCYQAKKKGYKIIYNPEVSIYHHKYGSSNNRILMNRIHFYVSMFKFLFKYRSNYISFNYLFYLMFIIFVIFNLI